ncbi:MAG: glycosyltransferase family 4 protein [Acidobacteria bacterium]|nr:glycosyltransferase family 4 protein [Acidobacteriota bacterium]
MDYKAVVKTKPRVLLVSSQPIQNAASLRAMAENPRVETLTAYCSLLDAKLWRDAENLNKEAFDLPMLEGYPWVEVKNYSPLPRIGKFYGLINPGLIALVARHDSCIVYGHAYISFWLAIATAKLLRKPVLLGTDATSLQSHYGGSNWKSALKKILLPFFYKHIANLVLVPSTASQRFICSLGVPEERVVLTPYVVDNDTIAAIAARADPQRLRREWQIPESASVVVFCAKFIERKRPHDALRAFAQAEVANSYLVMVGDGPLADSLRDEAERLGITERVRFLGIVKYSHLPEVYAASNLLLFPSEHEPYGLPVNEAMICGLPAIVSDRIGAGFDLIENGKTGFIYPCGDLQALTAVLRRTLADSALLQAMGEAARQRIATWSPRENAEATIRGAEQAMAARPAKIN